MTPQGSLTAPRRRLAIAAAAIVVCPLLFATGLALAPASANQAAKPPAAEIPAVAVAPAQPAQTLRIGALRRLERPPVLAKPAPRKPQRRKPARTVSPPAAAVAPPVAPPAFVPQPPALPPPPTCIGAGCDYR